MVLVGMQPVLTQVPPNSLRSITATCIPAPAVRAASDGPACPVPITIASKALPTSFTHGFQRTSKPFVLQRLGRGSIMGTYDFLVDTYETERVKVVSVWSMFKDDQLEV